MNSNKRVRESQNISSGNKKMEDSSESSSESSDESTDFADVLYLMDENETLDLLKCPLCTNVHTEVTLISKCLHRFCTECIRQKLREDGTRGCPVCHINLGCNPEQYLRHDKDMGLFAQNLVEYFRLRKGMPANSHDDKLEPEASGVQAVPQDTETSHAHGDVTRKKYDPAMSDESKHVPEERETSEMTYTKRGKN